MSRVLQIPLTEEEAAVFDELLVRGGFRSESHVVKCGIGQIADRYDIPMSADCYAVPYGPKMRALLERERPTHGTPLLDLDLVKDRKGA